MMPLILAKAGQTNTIVKIGGKEKTRKFLESLGFVAGSEVTVISEIAGNVIVKGRAEFARCENSWRWRGKTPHHGHGHHKGH